MAEVVLADSGVEVAAVEDAAERRQCHRRVQAPGEHEPNGPAVVRVGAVRVRGVRLEHPDRDEHDDRRARYPREAGAKDRE